MYDKLLDNSTQILTYFMIFTSSKCHLCNNNKCYVSKMEFLEDLPSAEKVVSSRRTRPSRTTAVFMLSYRKYSTFKPWNNVQIQFRRALRTYSTVQSMVRRVWPECPTLGCSTVCRWSIHVFSGALDLQASALLIGQHLAVIIIKLWWLISVLSVPEMSS